MTSPGRLRTPDRDLIELQCRELREIEGIGFGYRHTAECIPLPGQPTPSNVAYQILHPLRAPVNRPVRVHDHMFVAKYVDYLGHTDLHELHASASSRTIGSCLTKEQIHALRSWPKGSGCSLLLVSSEMTTAVSAQARHLRVFLGNTGGRLGESTLYARTKWKDGAFLAVARTCQG
jgi:hypothetical protein